MKGWLHLRAVIEHACAAGLQGGDEGVDPAQALRRCLCGGNGASMRR
jgi:hypothetical protein